MCVVHFMCSGTLKCLIQHSSEPVYSNVLFMNCYVCVINFFRSIFVVKLHETFVTGNPRKLEEVSSCFLAHELGMLSCSNNSNMMYNASTIIGIF